MDRSFAIPQNVSPCPSRCIYNVQVSYRIGFTAAIHTPQSTLDISMGEMMHNGKSPTSRSFVNGALP